MSAAGVSKHSPQMSHLHRVGKVAASGSRLAPLTSSIATYVHTGHAWVLNRAQQSPARRILAIEIGQLLGLQKHMLPQVRVSLPVVLLQILDPGKMLGAKHTSSPQVCAGLLISFTRENQSIVCCVFLCSNTIRTHQGLDMFMLVTETLLIQNPIPFQIIVRLKQIMPV